MAGEEKNGSIDDAQKLLGSTMMRYKHEYPKTYGLSKMFAASLAGNVVYAPFDLFSARMMNQGSSHPFSLGTFVLGSLKMLSTTVRWMPARNGSQNVCKAGKTELDQKNKDNSSSGKLLSSMAFISLFSGIEAVAGNTANVRKFFIAQDRTKVLNKALRPKPVFGPVPVTGYSLKEKVINYKTTAMDGLGARVKVLGVGLPFAYAKSVVGISTFVAVTGSSCKENVNNFYMAELAKASFLSDSNCKSVANIVTNTTFGYIGAGLSLPFLMLQNMHVSMTTNTLVQPSLIDTTKKLISSKGVISSYGRSLGVKGAGYAVFYWGFNKAVEVMNNLENDSSNNLAP